MNNPAPAWIFGGTSTLGRALARQLAAQRRPLVLLGRNQPRLEEIAADLRIRHDLPVVTFPLEAVVPLAHRPEILHHAHQTPPGLVLFVWGDDSQPLDHANIQAQEELIRTNFTSHVLNSLALLHAIPNPSPTAWVFIGSAGGIRPRAANLLYTTAKHALHGFTEGFRQLASPSKMTVHLIVLGYMKSPMSQGKCPPSLAITPTSAAHQILSAVGRSRTVTYVPTWWSLPCLLLRLLPSSVWGKLG